MTIRSGYRPEIDGLRAIAVLAVLCYHAGLPGFGGGYVGVDIFFVISGYLITGIIRTPIERDEFSIADFYERRARRIVPALTAVPILTAVAALCIMPPRSLAVFGDDLFWTALSLSNLHFWKSSGYFTAATDLSALIHTWSLAVEEQFYVFYPLALALSYRVFRGRLAWVLAIGLVVSLALSIWAAGHAPMAGFFLFPPRAWELLAGALLTYLKPIPVQSRSADGVALAGLAMIALAIAQFDDTTPFPGWAAALPVGGTALLIAATVPTTLVGRTLGFRPMVAIGLVSYSLYLIHQPVLALARIANVQPLRPDQTFLALVLSGALAVVSWRWIEQPFRRQGSMIQRRSMVFAASLTTFAGLAGVGYALSASSGMTQRFAPQQLATIRSAPGDPADAGCLRDFTNIDPSPCILGNPSAYRRFAVVGDSHAWQLVPALRAIAAERGWRIDVYAKSACPPGGLDFIYDTLRRRYGECPVWAAKLPLIQGRYSAVLMTASGAGYRLNRSEPIDPARWQALLVHEFSRLRAQRIPVIWALNTPRFIDFDPLLCAERGVLFGQPTLATCAVPAANALDPAMRGAERAAAAATGAAVVDLSAVLCTSSTCSAVLNGKPAMRDSNHVSRPVALRLGQSINAAFGQQATAAP